MPDGEIEDSLGSASEHLSSSQRQVASDHCRAECRRRALRGRHGHVSQLEPCDRLTDQVDSTRVVPSACPQGLAIDGEDEIAGNTHQLIDLVGPGRFDRTAGPALLGSEQLDLLQ